MAAPRKDNPRRAVTYKLPPVLLDQIAAKARRTNTTRTDVVERACEAYVGAEPRPEPARPPEPAQAVLSRANAPVLDAAQARAAAFRAATRKG